MLEFADYVVERVDWALQTVKCMEFAESFPYWEWDYFQLVRFQKVKLCGNGDDQLIPFCRHAIALKM